MHSVGLCNLDGVFDVEEDTEEESISAPPYSPPDDASFDQIVESDQNQCGPDMNKEYAHQVYYTYSGYSLLLINQVSEQPSGLHSGVHGYKFVGDSIDKPIWPPFQRHNKGVVSLHYFQGYAVWNRWTFHSYQINDPLVLPLILLSFFPPHRNWTC